MTDKQKRRAETAKPSLTELDCSYESEAVCPYCGYRDYDSWEYPIGSTETECGSCGRPFSLEVQCETTYTTAPIGGWNDGEE